MRWPFRRLRRLRRDLGPVSSGGRIVGDWRMIGRDGRPYMLSRGAVALSRAEFDRVGMDALVDANTGPGLPPTRPDVTIVEPDGSLTEIEGSGP